MMSDLRAQLLDVRAQHGALTPAIVVDAARPDDHPLHPRFEWNDTVAAEAHRRAQARNLIASVVRDFTRPNGRKGSVREFHAIRGAADSSTYEPVDDVVANPLQTQMLLAQMRRDWQTFKRRYEHFDEFRQMIVGDLEGAVA